MPNHNFKTHIAKLVQDLQKRLKATDAKWTQETIGQHLYPDSTDPRERYRSRFIRRVKTTRFDSDEILNFIALFAPVMHPREAILLIVWSQIEHQPFNAVRSFFNQVEFDQERQAYEQSAKRLYTLREDLSKSSPTTESHHYTSYIPLERTGPEYEQVDLGSLVGVEKIIDTITNRITAARGSNFISIEGQGGIGKTTIAYAVIDRIRKMRTFKAVIWLALGNHFSLSSGITELGYIPIWQQLGQRLNVEQQEQVIQILQNEPYLVVIDNIETSEDAHLALDGLVSLAQGNSRFLLTSRRELRIEYPFVNAYRLPFLSEEDAIELIQQLFSQRGQPIPQSKAKEIAIIGGGVPLAIHLIERLARVQSLNTILDEVSEYQAQANNRFEKIEIMFEYIYGRIWQNLREDVRDLLVCLALQIPSEGIYRDDAAISCGLSENQLGYSLEQAVEYYLIRQVLQSDAEVLMMHPLTISYIRSRLDKAQ